MSAACYGQSNFVIQSKRHDTLLFHSIEAEHLNDGVALQGNDRDFRAKRVHITVFSIHFYPE